MIFLLEPRRGNVAFTADIRGDSKTSFDIFGEITTLSLEGRGEDLIIWFEIRGDRTAFSVDSRGVSVTLSNDPRGDVFPFRDEARAKGAVFSAEARATSLEL